MYGVSRLVCTGDPQVRWEHPLISVSRFGSRVWSVPWSVVCPCIAVMGLGPTACNRVEETTGGAAHDERRDHGVSQCRGGLAPTARLTGC